MNDGSDWIVSASLTKPLPYGIKDAASDSFRVGVFRFRGNDIEMIYDDTKDVRIGINEIIPPDKLVCISDYANSGEQRLVVADAQSDVSPTMFRAYRWDDANHRFQLKEYFEILNCKTWQEPGDEYPSKVYVTGGFDPLLIHEVTYLIADQFGKVTGLPMLHTENPGVKRILSSRNYGGCPSCSILRFDSRGASCCMFEYIDVASRERVVFIQDSDGSDEGLLAFQADYSNKPWRAEEPANRWGWFRYFKLCE
ncbi:MAG: hypothetical protein HY770_05280 [Chitinivibrionia bacterium]|nr:hypothetical protein [Chitinivibrionia bacterium]